MSAHMVRSASTEGRVHACVISFEEGGGGGGGWRGDRVGLETHFSFFRGACDAPLLHTLSPHMRWKPHKHGPPTQRAVSAVSRT